MYKLFLMLRYLREGRIAYFAVGAVTLCVALVMIQRSVMGGWLEQVKLRSRLLLGDIVVRNGSQTGFPLYEEFIQEIRAWPEVEMATPVLITYGLLHLQSSRREFSNTAMVVGLRLREAGQVNGFLDSLFYERHYPNTTTLGLMSRPLLGVDTSVEARPIDRGGGAGRVFPPALPEPYHTALLASRAAARPQPPSHAEYTTQLNALLAQAGFAPVPGEWDFDADGDAARLDGPELPGVILGRDLVAWRHPDGRYERYFPLGTEVKLTLWAVTARGQVDPIPIKRSFRYADDSRTGVYEIDSTQVYCDFDELQRLIQMGPAERVNAQGEVIGVAPARCSQVQIKLRPGVPGERLAELTQRMRAVFQGFMTDARFDLDSSDMFALRSVEARTWEQAQAHIIGPVEKEKLLVTILFSIISLVAVTLIVCILYMIVLQKTRDIGIIKSIGGSSAGVAAVFIIYGAAVGLLGGLLGAVFGALFVQNINLLQDVLVRISPALRVWDMTVYSFDSIPSRVDPAESLTILAIAVAAAALGSVWAALRAGAMQPVEALRYE